MISLSLSLSVSASGYVSAFLVTTACGGMYMYCRYLRMITSDH